MQCDDDHEILTHQIILTDLSSYLLMSSPHLKRKRLFGQRVT